MTGTLEAAEIPTLLKRNHIIKGYRKMHQPWYYYCQSAFCAHNEVMNVWTHFVPAVIIAIFYVFPELAREDCRFPVLILYTGIITLLLGSTFAHLMHSRSPLDHIFWFLIDFSGIALFGISIGLQRYACSTDMTLINKLSYIPLLMFVVLGMQFFSSSYLFVCVPTYPKRLYLRMLTCFLLAIWLYIPILHRYLVSLENPDEDVALSYHTRAFLWLLFSGIFMGAHIPERFSPGTFDILGYGHQLFHLCINMVAWNLCSSADIDCKPQEMNKTTDFIVGSAFLFSVIFIVSTLVFLMGEAKHSKYE